MHLTANTGRVAVITGANRGIGLETARQLADRGFRVFLTARGEARARDAAHRLGVEHLHLDVTDTASIEAAEAEIRGRCGSVDVLVNNAGVLKHGSGESVARETIAVNLLGAMAVTDQFRPLLAETASVVMVSSVMGQLAGMSPELRAQFEDPGLTRDRLTGLMEEFIRESGGRAQTDRGWPRSAYTVSKAGLNAFTRILARELAETRIRVNSVCPGWVRTDMGGAGAPRGVGQGAQSIAWAATLAPDGPSGGFFTDGRTIPW